MTTTALILGGGGVTGVAWEIGLLSGLAAAGLDPTTADLTVGTSAGSVVGAQLTSGVDLETLYRTQCTPPTGEIPARISGRVLLTWLTASLRGGNPQQVRARIGAMALAAPTIPEDERRAVIAARLPSHTWPRQRLLVTAVDATTGQAAVFDHSGDVSLVDAVAASCAVPGVWPPVTINGRRFVDGGVRSPANADLAAGYDRILVLAPITRASRGNTPASQARALRAKGASVLVISPDRKARHAIGGNVLDPARRPAAAAAGRAQATALAAGVAAHWHR